MRGNNRLAVLFATGFCAIPAQVILMREFLLVFGGNELVIGLFLAIWMLLTSAGSIGARYLRLNASQIPFYAIFMAWMPVVMLYLIDLLRNHIFLPGIEPGFFPALLALFLLLLPFCFLSGLLFASVAGQLTRQDDAQLTDKAYGIEALGSMAGGFLFSLALVYISDNFRSASIVALLSSMMILFSPREKVRRSALITLSVLLSSIMILILCTGSRFPRQFLFRNQHLLEVRDTPYGNLAVTVTSGQMNFYENNQLLYSTDNPAVCEEAVHFAMLQHPYPTRVLLISGGIAGITDEILKYTSVQNLDYIEIDPAILDIGKKYTHFLADKRIRLLAGDPRIYLRRTERKYDVVIVFLPPPSSFFINRYYTLEFMQDVKQCMNIQGIFTFSLPLTGSYLNDGSVIMYSSLLNTCIPVFRNVHLFPGQNCYFVATNRVIYKNIGQLIEYKKIKTDYVNSYYIDEDELERNSESVLSQLHLTSAGNTDFHPIVITGFYKYWLGYFRIEFRTARFYALLISSLIILFLAFASPSFSGMFAAGFTVSALQVILVLSFQIVYGYMYRSIGLFTAVFMTGLATGSFFRRHLLKSSSARGLIYLQFILAGLAAMIPFLITWSQMIREFPFLVHLLYLAAIFIISVTTGVVFSMSVHIPGKPGEGIIRRVYAADLAGASMGALMTVMLLIPVAGLKLSPCVAGFLNLVVAAVMITRRRIVKIG